MISVKRYNKIDKNVWDSFISSSRIDSFLFYRDFMDYHADRFVDCSFLVFKKNRIVGLIPGNIENDLFYSHQGLTYGGLITNNKITTKDIIETFKCLNKELKSLDVKNVIYKPTPHIYHLIPQQEDIYVLFLLNAIKVGCNLSSTIYQQSKIPFIEARKGGIRKSQKESIKIIESSDFESFWQILTQNLMSVYNKMPVHSLDEIIRLHSVFKDNIKLFLAVDSNSIVYGGSVLFVMKNVVHVQYISANQEGKVLGVLDLLFDELINYKYANYKYFDFGQSTEESGRFLNENLIFQKEGFGARGVVYDIYSYSI